MNAADQTSVPPALPAPMQQWLQYLQTQRRYAVHTLSAYAHDLHQLCAVHANIPLAQLHEDHIRQAVAHLHRQGIQARSLARALSAWRGFFQWWSPQVGLAQNPAAQVRAPKAPRSLPKALPVDMAMALFQHVSPNAQPQKLRDHAMAEVLYSSGLRLTELVSLDWCYTQRDGYTSQSWLQLDAAEATVCGKGGKTRSVPLGQPAVLALQRWLTVRTRWLCADHVDAQAALFLSARGQRISPRTVQRRLQYVAQKAKLPVHVHPHMLRHSFASHLLQSAQDLRAVQELLGHAHISSTQIYTQLDFQHLSQVYDQAHPRAQRKREEGAE